MNTVSENQEERMYLGKPRQGRTKDVTGSVVSNNKQIMGDLLLLIQFYMESGHKLTTEPKEKKKNANPKY